jgi:hypothetical protein
MGKIYPILLLCLFAISVIAQDPEITIRKCIDAETTPVVDGTVDDVWDYVDGYQMEETQDPPASIYEGVWKMMWSDESLFVLVSVDDDNHCDQWCTGLNDWESDRVEFFIDVNEVLWDTLGANPNEVPGGPTAGHYQFTGPWTQDITEYSGEASQWPSNNPYNIGYYIEGDYFDYEFGIPWSSLVDCTSVVFAPADGKMIGIQVVMVDVDGDDVSTRKFLNWKDIDAWDNMDSAGVIILSDAPVNTGIFDKEALMTIEVYPNPAKDYITINTEPGKATEVRIYNTIGQEVLWIEKYNGARIYLASLKTGVYYAVVYDNKRKLLGKNRFTIIK